MSTGKEPYVLSTGEGKSIWFLGGLVTFKATGKDTGGSFSLAENLLPPGFATPFHVHHAEEEHFYVLEGEVTFLTSDRVLKATPGTFLFCPKGIAHGFRVEGAKPARLLILTMPSGFENFVEDGGELAEGAVLPPEKVMPIDKEKLIAAAAKQGIEILGPLPEK